MNKEEFKKTDIWINANDKEKIEILERLLDIAEEQNKELIKKLMKEGLKDEYDRKDIILRKKELGLNKF